MIRKRRGFIVATAAPADFPDLAAFAADAYRAGFSAILPPETLARFDAAYFVRYFALAATAPVVARCGAALLGFHLTENGHLKMLFVAPGRQKTGIGSALLADALKRGAARLECLRDNAQARRFYEARGWVRVRAYWGPFGDREYAFCVYEKQMT